MPKFKCDECDFSTEKRGNLNRHLRTQHSKGEEDIFKCIVCNRSFPTTTQLGQHIKTDFHKKNLAAGGRKRKVIDVDAVEEPKPKKAKIEFNVIDLGLSREDEDKVLKEIEEEFGVKARQNAERNRSHIFATDSVLQRTNRNRIDKSRHMCNVQK